MTKKLETSKFYHYDIVVNRIFLTKCAVRGCRNTKKTDQAICNKCWEKIPDKSINKMYAGTWLGDLLTTAANNLINNEQDKERQKKLIRMYLGERT